MRTAKVGQGESNKFFTNNIPMHMCNIINMHVRTRNNSNIAQVSARTISYCICTSNIHMSNKYMNNNQYCTRIRMRTNGNVGGAASATSTVTDLIASNAPRRANQCASDTSAVDSHAPLNVHRCISKAALHCHFQYV